MSRRARQPREPITLTIDSLSHEGRGVGRNEGKTVFVHGALPGERVTAQVVKRRGRFDEAVALDVLEASPERVDPLCAHFGVCGGCSFQHATQTFQLEHKQRVLLELLEHTAGVQPATVAAPIHSHPWAYRRKARLGVKHVPAKGGVIVGFRERATPYITHCDECVVLDARVGSRLVELREMMRELLIAAQIPQIEVAAGDDAVALVFRCLALPSARDRELLARFQQETGLEIYLQPGGLNTVEPLEAGNTPLRYGLGDLQFEFLPVDFTQVNAAINARLIERALEYLKPAADDRVLDLFCGLGNFSLPVAQRVAQVQGYEGDAGLIRRALANAERNQLANCFFEQADLADPAAVASITPQGFNKVIIDPPRSGAGMVVEHLRLEGVERLVYVSCNPATLARDVKSLCHERGFQLVQTGILDMFPHTAHVESISLLHRV